MALNETQKKQFIDGYTKAMVTSWSDEDFAERLKSDPRAALAESGIELPANARIELVTNIAEGEGGEATREQRLDHQVELYEKGLETGHFEFRIPSTPQVSSEDLDVDELAGVAGGVACCCCPCCCCWS